MKHLRILAAILVLACLAPAQSPSLERKPYVQNVSEQGASILWTTRQASTGEVRYSADGVSWKRQPALSQRLQPQETGLAYEIYQHRADLGGLSAGTTYRYRVLLEGVDALPHVAGEDLQVRTASRLEQYQFLVLGDSGDGTLGQAELADRMSHTGDPEFVLHTGDLAYENGTFREYEDFYFRVYWPLMRRIPFFPAPGNHDYNFRDGATFRAVHVLPDAGVPEAGLGRYYSFDWGNTHFVALDTNTPFREALEGRGEMLRWLDADLAATRKTWRVVYFHHTPFPTAAHRFDSISAEALLAITPILEKHQVQVVFNGHEHLYQRSKARRDGRFVDGRGVVYITTGGGAERVYPAGTDDFVAIGSGLSHFVLVTVNGPAMLLQAIDQAGFVLDRFELQATPQIEAVGMAGAGSDVLAAGGLVSLSGWNLAVGDAAAQVQPWPSRLGGVDVTVGSIPAALQRVSRATVVAQVGYEISGDVSLMIGNGAGRDTRTVRMHEVAPAVVRLPVRDRTDPAITRMDGSIVNNEAPAREGEVITVWMVGLGAVSPAYEAGHASETGTLAPTVRPVRIFIGEREAQVLYAGLAPGMPGLYQVNLQVPRVIGGIQLVRIEQGDSTTHETLPTALP